MAYEVLDHADPRFPKGGPDIGEDMLARQKRAHARKVDEREEFQTETVVVSTGQKDAKGNSVNLSVGLRWPRSAQIIEQKDDLGNVVHRERVWTGGRFVFAVFADNPETHAMARDVWEAHARNALEKFCAMRKLSIVQGPRPEDTNRYNIMVEVREPINAS